MENISYIEKKNSRADESICPRLEKVIPFNIEKIENVLFDNPSLIQ